jgi:hypothetical protein
MIAKVCLVDDGPPTVAVGAANLALLDLAFQVGDRALAAGELDDTRTLDSDVVEVQDHRILLPAIDARRFPKVAEQVEKVPAS